jgi:aminomethyltransferase
MKEHLHTRAAGCSSVFDVGHMGQIKWHGKDAVKFIEKMVVSDIASLKPTEAKLSLIMNEAGGIVDDCVITNAGDHIYMVVNGACKYKDMDHFNKYLAASGLDVGMEYLDDRQLLAVQGPGAHTAVAALAPKLNVKAMNFMSGTMATVAGIQNCRVTRCGYTGEDGFEISVDVKNAHALMDALMKQPGVKPCGLGARDSLRLEAGLCLYGNDLNEEINPVEGALTWVVGGPKSRRRVEQGFLGADKFLMPDGKLKKQSRKRVGIAGMKAPARDHTDIFDASGSKKIGEITSGGFGPSYGAPVAMGYVSTEGAHEEGTSVMLSVRGKMLPAQITKMPFVENNYYRAP